MVENTTTTGTLTSSDAPAYEDEPEQVNKWAVAAAVATGALLEVIDTSIVNVALTEIQGAVGATLSQISWVVASYAVANVIVLPLSPWLGERFGKKRYFVFSMIGFTVASMLCGIATNLPMLVFARVLQGLAGGGLLAKAQAILFETFPREEQAMAQGFFGAIAIAGPVCGPTLGGFITTHSSWRWIFFVNVPIGIGAVLLCISALPRDKPRGPSQSVDWPAIALLAVGLGCFQTFLEDGNSEAWFESPYIALLAALAAFALATFVWRQLRSDRPVVDLRVLRYRSLWAGSLLSIVVGIALFGALFAVPVFAQSIMGYTSQQTGVMLLPGAITSAFTMVLASKLVRRFDPRLVLALGGVTLVLSLHWMAQLNTHTSDEQLFWPLIVRALGSGLMFLPLNLASISPIPRDDVAKATGLFNLTRLLGGSIGVALMSTILDQRMAFHRSILASHVAAADPQTVERINTLTHAFTSQGASELVARAQALAVIDGAVMRQASILSFNDTFLVTAALVLLILPLVLLLGKPPSTASVPDAH
ncbi:MAG TPA: DHA2 family efflux MFS transporter permease subunit [Polyangiales bacterium]|nr:DHA2 family efflux MFS transporter permease subunit [Polyangiales bacterium]